MKAARTTTAALGALAALATLATTAGPASATSGTACTGVSGCTIVSRVDVDGDGARDSVGLTTTWRSDGTGTATVRVLTARGARLSTATRVDRRLDDVYHGSARIDGAPGYEMVIQTDMGAHTPWFRAITYRDGRLTTLVDPHGAYRWTVDSAVWVGKGYRRTTTSTGALKMVSYVALDNNHDGRYQLTTKAVGWREGRWVHMSKSTRTVGAKEAYRYADWYVPYLPKAFA